MLHLRNFLTTAAAAAIAISLAACGGGGGGGTLPTTGGGSAPTSPQSATAKMIINIPAKSSSIVKNPKYISASTQSITVSTVNGSTVTLVAEADLTPSSAGCAAVTGGGTQCTVSVLATAGQQTFKLITYDQTGGKGNVLSSGNVVATLVAGQNTSIPLVLDGTAVAVSLALGVGTLPVGTPSSTTVTVQALDADNNLIVGPGAFTNPITLTITGDTYSTLALSSSTVSSPGQVVTLSYNGGTNVGSTITPSGSGVTGTAATFGGSGASLTMFQFFDTTNYISGYPNDVAALANGNAAVVMEFEGGPFNCCSYYDDYPYGIAIESPTGVAQNVFVGDTEDPYTTPAPHTTPGVTIVNGMSDTLETDTFGAYDAIAVNTTSGYIYYPGYFEVNDANTTRGNCSGSEESGTLGILNPATGTLVAPETILSGFAGDIKIDGSGNAWFLENPGSCNGNDFNGDTYMIGELTSGGALHETSFITAGLGAIDDPGDMSITADGSLMYITDEDNYTVYQIATATLTAPIVANLNESGEAYAIATAPDGTTAWWGDCDPVEDYYYGYAPKSTFGATTFSEAAFPVNNVWAESMSYADGSFWAGGDDEGAGGIARIAGLSAGTPQAAWYPTPSTGRYNYDSQEISSVSAAGGNVWGTDCNEYNIDVLQYGVPSNGAITFNKTRNLTTSAIPRNAKVSKHLGHAINRHARGRAHIHAR